MAFTLAAVRSRPMPIALRAFVATVIAAGLFAVLAPGLPLRDPRLWYWAAACAVGEMMWLRLPLGRATMSMGSTANFAALLVLPTPLAIPAATLASVCVERAILKKPLVRALFNAAGTALTVGATGLVLHLISPAGPFALHDARLLLELATAAATYYMLNRSLVTAVLALDGALPMSLVWRRNFGLFRDLVPSGAALSLGVLLAVLHQQAGLVAVAFVLLPALLVFEAHRRLYTATATRDGSRPPVLGATGRAVSE